MSKIVKTPTAPFSPFYGCAVMLAIISFVVGAVIWGWYTLNTQDAAIAKFAVEAPVKLSVNRVADVEPLKKRLAEFAAKPQGALELSIAELNSVVELAPDTGYGKFTEMIAFKAAHPEKQELSADVCLPMNKVKFWEGKRYAAGEAMFKPEIVEGAGIDIKLTALTVPGKDVDPMFAQALGGWRWLTPYQKMEQFTAVLKAITKVEVTATGVKLHTATP